MKKSFLSICAIIALITNVNAQAPVGGFENWVATPSPSASIDPIGWVSFNAVTLAGMPQTVFQETTAPFAGLISAKIVTDVLPATVMIPNPFNPIEDLDTVGLLAIGRFTAIFPPVLKYGYSYAWRPATLNFACKYTPVGGDTAFVVAFLTKWNGTSRDTVAGGLYKTGTTSSAFALQSFNLVYNPLFAAVMPDSQQIFVSSSVYLHDGAKKGSTFFIDDWSWTGYVGTNDITGQTNSVAVYPAPAADNVTFKLTGADANNVEVMDITGRLIGSYLMINNELNIQTSNFKSGLYLYQIVNASKEVINRGKFEISK